MGTETPGLRELKKQQTRESIADAALDLTLEKGLENVTIEEIAKVAFVSPRTVSNYFLCKEEAIVAAGTQPSKTLLGEFEERPAGEHPLLSLRALLSDFVVGHSPEELELSLRKMDLSLQYPSLRPFETARFDELEESLRDAIATRTGTSVTTDLYPWLAAAAAIAAVKSAMQIWAAATTSTLGLRQLIEEAFDQFSAGLPAPPNTPATD
ncbi:MULTISPECIES: TetR/AcrR family transcriptional regulator [Allobranchiibius]|uniref:AcrR family transcriptional regulator n=1 Tax=Allobranchiibius huperziae TaxID=1874116 RepID=A0A853DHR7_9MICO|nr:MULTISPECIES: TetR/AcrR family transcriptional regulator [Allobranchiibius]NYJ74290.1 AcrR family transcriptional regulator [Allobranchiibius huperziae]UIJ34302.1 TetR/AcrR family transcriptional regulator [Allobranchiibius sp. GilTou73]